MKTFSANTHPNNLFDFYCCVTTEEKCQEQRKSNFMQIIFACVAFLTLHEQCPWHRGTGSRSTLAFGRSAVTFGKLLLYIYILTCLLKMHTHTLYLTVLMSCWHIKNKHWIHSGRPCIVNNDKKCWICQCISKGSLSCFPFLQREAC